MNGFRNWMARLMIGRYGSDELNRFLLIVSAVLIVIGIFVPRHFLNVLVVVLLIIVYCRMFSRNHAKRHQENMKYLQMKAKFTGGRNGSAGSGANAPLSGKKKKPQPGKRIYICPYCKGSLQVPVGAGRIRIRCPHCGKEFEETV